MKRRNFINAAAILSLGIITSSRLNAAAFVKKTIEASNNFRNRIIEIIKELKNEGSNLVKEVMNGRKYAFDTYTHYPYDGGIKDETTGYQLFFHIHRENEYGHFHTFASDEDGELVHLILISMSEEGKPIGLATVNRWVTGDKYVKADVLMKLSENFFVNPSLYKDKRIIEFVNYIFKAYREEINQLYIQRDKWIKDYVNNNYREPFEDRNYEIVSVKEINMHS
jgi:hypothetical protein